MKRRNSELSTGEVVAQYTYEIRALLRLIEQTIDTDQRRAREPSPRKKTRNATQVHISRIPSDSSIKQLEDTLTARYGKVTMFHKRDTNWANVDFEPVSAQQLCLEDHEYFYDQWNGMIVAPRQDKI